MKLPFVSRELYEYAAREAEAWKAEYRALQYSIANPPMPEIELPPEPVRVEKVKDRISERIEEVSGGDRKVARHFRSMATQMRKDGKSDGDILAAIKMVSTEDTQ